MAHRVPRRRPCGPEIPSSPPACVLAEVQAAHVRAQDLARAGVEVDFAPDPGTGRLNIRLRSPRGERTLRPLEALALLD